MSRGIGKQRTAISSSWQVGEEDFLIPVIANYQQFCMLMRWHLLLKLYIRKPNIQSKTTATNSTISETVYWSFKDLKVNIWGFFCCFFIDCVVGGMLICNFFKSLLLFFFLFLLLLVLFIFIFFNRWDHCNHAEGSTCAWMPPEPHSGSSCKCNILLININTIFLCRYCYCAVNIKCATNGFFYRWRRHPKDLLGHSLSLSLTLSPMRSV